MIRLVLLLFLIAGSVPAENADEYISFCCVKQFTYSAVFEEQKYTDTFLPIVQPRLPYQILYFISNEDEKNPKAILEGMAGLGVFEKRRDGIYSYDCTWKEDIVNLKKLKPYLFVRNPIKEKDQVKIEIPVTGGLLKISVTVAGFEDVKVPAGNFPHALKLQIHHSWPRSDISPDGAEYDSTAWFAKNVGLVKWIRTTGRVDELASYK